ncbi:hypothetical protein [Halopolyspora algeriensis]|nr:hypothetical protein [Halopolyspora algeriensis]
MTGLLIMVMLSERMVPERVQVFWAALQRGAFIIDAAAGAGTHRGRGPAVARGRRVFARDVAAG